MKSNLDSLMYVVQQVMFTPLEYKFYMSYDEIVIFNIGIYFKTQNMVFFRKEKVTVHPLDVKRRNRNDNQDYGKFNQKAWC